MNSSARMGGPPWQQSAKSQNRRRKSGAGGLAHGGQSPLFREFAYLLGLEEIFALEEKVRRRLALDATPTTWGSIWRMMRCERSALSRQFSAETRLIDDY